MRVISGSAKGHKLRAPKGRVVRPTADRVREAIFSMLGGHVEGARVLDLYAGAGTLGIEALSRGAAGAVFVERSGRIAQVITHNLEACGLLERSRIVMSKALPFLAESGPLTGPFDLIFLDPPYRIANTEVEEDLKCLVKGGFLAKGGLVVLERPASAPSAAVGGLVARKTKVYGDTAITIFEKRAFVEG